MTDKVVVIMSVCGREQLTMNAIKTLKENTKHDHFLVVVDDFSGKTLRKNLERAEQRQLIDKLILLPEHTGRKGKIALNTGLDFVFDNIFDEIEYIAIQDNDFEFSEGWLSTCVEGLKLCQKYRGQGGFNIDAISVYSGNEEVHETLAEVNYGAFRIMVKKNLGGGQYVYSKAHMVGLGGSGDPRIGTKYNLDEDDGDSDWGFFRRSFERNHHAAHIFSVGKKGTKSLVKNCGKKDRVW